MLGAQGRSREGAGHSPGQPWEVVGAPSACRGASPHPTPSLRAASLPATGHPMSPGFPGKEKTYCAGCTLVTWRRENTKEVRPGPVPPSHLHGSTQPAPPAPTPLRALLASSAAGWEGAGGALPVPFPAHPMRLEVRAVSRPFSTSTRRDSSPLLALSAASTAAGRSGVPPAPRYILNRVLLIPSAVPPTHPPTETSGLDALSLALTPRPRPPSPAPRELPLAPGFAGSRGCSDPVCAVGVRPTRFPPCLGGEERDAGASSPTRNNPTFRTREKNPKICRSLEGSESWGGGFPSLGPAARPPDPLGGWDSHAGPLTPLTGACGRRLVKRNCRRKRDGITHLGGVSGPPHRTRDTPHPAHMCLGTLTPPPCTPPGATPVPPHVVPGTCPTHGQQPGCRLARPAAGQPQTSSSRGISDNRDSREAPRDERGLGSVPYKGSRRQAAGAGRARGCMGFSRCGKTPVPGHPARGGISLD